MSKRIKIIKLQFIIIFLCLNNICISQNYNGFREIIKNTENSVFLVYGLDQNNKVFSQGSGFFISSNGVGITNYHVLSGCKKAFIKTKDGKNREIISVIDYNCDFDLVKFKIKNVENTFFHSLKLAQRIPVKGDGILSISNPMGLEQTISEGIVSSIREMNPYGTLIQITAPISEGSSGSPIINLQEEVVGISTMCFKNGQNLNFAVSSKKILQLNKNQNIGLEDMGKSPYETPLIKKAFESYLQGNLNESQNYIYQELKNNILNHIALNFLAQIFLDKKEYKKAGDFFYKAYQQDDTNYEYLNSLGVANSQYCYINNGDTSSLFIALGAYSEAIELNPEFESAYYNRAFLIFNYLFAIKKSVSALDNSSIYNALNDLNKLIEINPFSAKAYYLRSMIKYELKDNWSSLSDADKSIEIDKSNFEFYFNRATIKNLGIGDFRNGLLDLNIAFQLTNDQKKRADIKGSSSVCKYKLGDRNGACNDAKEAYLLEKSETYKELINSFCN